MRQETVIRHGEDGFAGMRKAGKLAAAVLDMIRRMLLLASQQKNSTGYVMIIFWHMAPYQHR